MPWAEQGWPGGRVWIEKDGSKRYWIRRSVNGRRFEMSTQATTLRGAMAQLEKFEKDPAAYVPGGQDGDKLTFTPTLRDQFLDWSEHEKKNTKEWVRRQRAYLMWWQEKLDRLDLRHVKLRDHILPALVGAKSRGPRIAVLKAFFSYLRKERHLLTFDQDPTLDMRVPQAQPEQWKRSKVVPEADYRAVLAKLNDAYADLLRVLWNTGMHIVELNRFAKDGSVVPLVGDRSDGATHSMIIPRHKNGETQRVAVPAEVAEAAQRILGRGGFGESRFSRAVGAACKAANVAHFGPGQLRHTFATRYVDGGEDVGRISAFLGHKSPQTTRRFYATLATVPRPVLRIVSAVEPAAATVVPTLGVPEQTAALRPLPAA